MQQKVRELHGLNVPRDLVYAVMGEADPDGLKDRSGVGQSNRPRRTDAFVAGVSSGLSSSCEIQTLNGITFSHHLDVLISHSLIDDSCLIITHKSSFAKLLILVSTRVTI